MNIYNHVVLFMIRRDELNLNVKSVLKNDYDIIRTYTYTDYMNFILGKDECWNVENINRLKKQFSSEEYFKDYFLIFKKINENELILQIIIKRGK